MVIRIPQREQQTVLQSTQAAQPRVSGPVRDAYSAPEAQAMQQVARGLEQAGGVLYDLQQQQKALNMSAFEADAELAAKKYADELANSNDYLSFGQKYSEFEKSIQEMGKARLGDAAYDNWAATKGKLFMGGIQLDTAQQTAQKKSVALKGELQQNLKQLALLSAYAQTPQLAGEYRKQAENLISSAYNPAYGTPYINELEKQKFEKDFGQETDLQDIERLSQYSAVKAYNSLQNPANYKWLTRAQREQISNKLLLDITGKSASSGGGGTVKTDPNVYVSFENDIANGDFDQGKLNWAYTQGQITLADKRALEKQQEELIPSAKKQAVDLISARFSTSSLDSRFGDIAYTRTKALQSFEFLLKNNPKATDFEIAEFANRVIDEYQQYDYDTRQNTLPLPKDALDSGINREQMKKLTQEQLDDRIQRLFDRAKMEGGLTPDISYQISQYNEWYPFIKSRDEKAAKRAQQNKQGVR